MGASDSRGSRKTPLIPSGKNEPFALVHDRPKGLLQENQRFAVAFIWLRVVDWLLGNNSTRHTEFTFGCHMSRDTRMWEPSQSWMKSGVSKTALTTKKAMPSPQFRPTHDKITDAMPELIHYEIRDQVAVLTVDNPPVNALSPGIPEAIEASVERAGKDPAARAVVLIGAGTTFIAGADIRFFETITTHEASLERSRSVHSRLRHIEDCPKPVVAAIHGTALGGGLEFAMACHYRVAVASAKVGQPEVLLRRRGPGRVSGSTMASANTRCFRPCPRSGLRDKRY
jgi:hypothetical protein